MANVPMERHLLDMPYEISFEIFRQLPKGKLFKISRFPSKFGNVAGDPRLWKDVYIRYDPGWIPESEYFAFEQLYSGPFSVKVIDLTQTPIKSPYSFEADQVVKVTELKWSSVTAAKVTVEALLAKYQCTKLHLDYIKVHPHGHTVDIAPEAFSKQTALEVLSLKGAKSAYHVEEARSVIELDIGQWLVTVLSKYCKNLKSLDLSYSDLRGLDLVFVESLPTTLEKLCLASYISLGNFFFELLAKHRPNLKEIGVCSETVKYPALLKFKCLEALHIIPLLLWRDISDLYKYLIRFPALKKVHIKIDRYYAQERKFEMLRTKLEPHGIATVSITEIPAYPMDGNLWRVHWSMDI